MLACASAGIAEQSSNLHIHFKQELNRCLRRDTILSVKGFAELSKAMGGSITEGGFSLPPDSVCEGCASRTELL